MKISKVKKYKTRSGLPVRIYAVDGGSGFPVHGAVKAGGWMYGAWMLNGSFLNLPSEYDLIPITKPRKVKKKGKV